MFLFSAERTSFVYKYNQYISFVLKNKWRKQIAQFTFESDFATKRNRKSVKHTKALN